MCVCVCGNVKPSHLESTPGRKTERISHSRTHKIESTATARHPWLTFCAMQNSNFYPVNMLKKSLIAIMGGVGG